MTSIQAKAGDFVIDAALLADTLISQTAGAADYAADGDLVQAGPYLYEVDSTATVKFVTNENGVKFVYVPVYVIDPRALGARMDAYEAGFTSAVAPTSGAYDSGDLVCPTTDAGRVTVASDITDDTDAWNAAVELARETGMEIHFSGLTYCSGDIGSLDSDGRTFTLVGGGNLKNNQIFFGPGAGIVDGNSTVSSSCSANDHRNFVVRDARPDRGLTESDLNSGGDASGDVDQTGGDSPLWDVGWDDKPLIYRGRGYNFNSVGVVVQGQGYRLYGGIYGAPLRTDEAVMWNSQWLGNTYEGCAVGRVIGCAKDSTGIVSKTNTIHQNYWVGDVLLGPNGADLSDSVEQNYGPWGRAFYSYASAITSVTQANAYMFNNCRHHSGKANTAGILLGVPVYGTPFEDVKAATSVAAPSGWEVNHNYIVSDHQSRAVIANVFRFGEIRGNTEVTADNSASGAAFEILSGSGRIEIYGNYNQNSGLEDRYINGGSSDLYLPLIQRPSSGLVNLNDGYLLDGVAGTVRVQDGISRRDSSSDFDRKAGVLFVKKSFVTGGVWETLLTFDSYYAVAEIVLTLESTSETLQSRHVIHVSDLDSGAITAVYNSPSTPPDSTVFQVSGSNFQVKRNNNWQGMATVTYAGSPY